MKQRFRLDHAMAAREDADAEMDFPERATLRERIVAAAVKGDVAALASLRAQHRAARLAFRQSTRPVGARGSNAPAGYLVEPPDIVRTSHHVLALTDRGDVALELVALPLTWGPRLTVLDNPERIVMLNVQPSSITSWFRAVNHMPLVADHATYPCGVWHSFTITEVGLRSTAQADDTPAGRELLAACTDGRAVGCSFAAKILASHRTGRTINGLPEVFADSIWLTEAGPSPDPSDERAVILSAGGKMPTYRAQAALVGKQRPAGGQQARRRAGWPGKRGWRWSG